MNDYAIVSLSGRQYKISVGDKITVDNLSKNPGDKLTISEVLLARTRDKILVGQPYIENHPVVAKVVNNQKGEKLHVSKYKAKSRYRKTIGFRAQQTVIQIESIGGIRENEPAPKETKEPKKRTKSK